MTIECIACGYFKFERTAKKEPTNDAKNGGGRCALKGAAYLTSALYKRECEQYSATDMGQVIKLRAWLAQQPGGK